MGFSMWGDDMEKVMQVRHGLRWGGIISGEAVLLRLWGILVLSLGIIATSPCISIAASSLDILDRQRDQSRPDPLSKPRIQITEGGKLSVASPAASRSPARNIFDFIATSPHFFFVKCCSPKWTA